MGSRVVGWAAIVCGALVLPHYLIVQVAVGGILIWWGATKLFGGLPLPLREAKNGQRKQRSQDERSSKEE